MTAPAEGSLVRSQQIIPGSLVGRVAEQTLPLHCRGMGTLIFTGMTVPAQLLRTAGQKRSLPGIMARVAFKAFPRPPGRVTAALGSG